MKALRGLIPGLTPRSTPGPLPGLTLSVMLGFALGLTQYPCAAQAPAPLPAPAQTLERELASIAFDPANTLASLSVLAIRAGKISYQGQFGLRHIDPAVPAEPATLYRIASISKMMTTIGLMKLIEEGKLSLDADAGTYLGFALRNPHFPDRVITLRMLLTHTSSLRDEAGYSWPNATALKDVLQPGAKLYGNGAAWGANAAPGAYFSYCNLNWGVIGTIMEAVSGERFDRLMQRLLLEPMGLRGGFNPAEFAPAELADLATLYRKRGVDTEIWDSRGPWIAQVDDYRTRPPQPPPGLDRYVLGSNATPFSPTGGLRISAADMGAIMLMLMNGGQHQGRQILRASSIATMFAIQWTADGQGANGDTSRGLFNRWGLGNQQFPDLPGKTLVEGGGFAAVGHLGEAYGLLSVFAFDPLRKDGLVVLIGGSAADPEREPGRYSAMPRFEERILTALYRQAIATP